MSSHTISLPACWIDANHFERSLSSLDDDCSHLTIIFPPKCSVMVDASLRLLSLVNQFSLAKKNVDLHFCECDAGAMGYLNRIGFFDLLHSEGRINVFPSKPIFSGAKIYAGNNSGTVEIGHVIDEKGNLPKKLAGAIAQNKNITKLVEDDIWFILAELIQNIPTHSGSLLGGYAALQSYRGGNKLKVAVSDGGAGVLTTLRPVLAAKQAPEAFLDDTSLLLEMFRKGISRFGYGRGHGLKESAAVAIKYNATLDVRLARSRIELQPSADGYTPHLARCSNSLPYLAGTHFCFTFPLDSSR